MQRKVQESQIIQPETEQKKTKTDLTIRLISSAFIVGGIIFIITMGQAYILILNLIVAVLLFKEIIGLLKIKMEDQPVNVSTKISWYYFISSILFFLISYFKDIQHYLYDNYGYDFQKYKKSTAFTISIIGFVSFVFTLKKKYVKQQINLFFVTILTIVFINVILSSVTVYYFGIIWLFMSCFNVAINDSGAYFVGKSLGKTPLYSLSPKKTVEGFVGGLVFTIILGFIMLKVFELDFFKPMYCRQMQLTFEPFSYPDCELLPLYIKRKIWFRGLSHIFGYFYLSEFQVHMFIFMLFASLIAPFGGFFASGLKRALQIKDFSNLIPGHGGILDRLDCHFFMLIFASVYISEIVKGRSHSISSVQNYLSELSIEDQRKIQAYLQEMLEVEEILSRIKDKKQVEGYIICNNKGEIVKSTYKGDKKSEGDRIVHNLPELVALSKVSVKNINENNELQFLRIKTKICEFLISPDSEDQYVFIVVQSLNVKTNDENLENQINFQRY